VADSASTSPRQPTTAAPDRRWILAALGAALMTVAHPLLWQPEGHGLWFAPLGLGLVLIAWLGPRFTPLVIGQFVLARLLLPHAEGGFLTAVLDGALSGAAVVLGWWCYHDQAGGARRLDDPRSATLFLLLVPGLAAWALAMLRVLLRHGVPADYLARVLDLWLTQGLGILALAPMLLAVGTPWVVYYRWALPERTDPPFQTHPRLAWTTGEVLETVGLALGAAMLGGVLASVHATGATNWHLWGVLLLLIVWASLRLGLRGGSLVAGSATVFALVLGAVLANNPALLLPLRGNLLAQCSTALLIGASADWIRASEARYRQIVGHIPVILYSARFLRRPAPGVRPQVQIQLVSTAARAILRCEPEALLGSYDNWLERVHPADRELLRAALSQLLLQKQPVTCEYRLADASPGDAKDGQGTRAGLAGLPNLVRHMTTPPERWVRDTLVPHYAADEQLDGWEGVVEDITDQRILAHDLRRTTNMLHALVANLPTGVFFVHGINGQPLLVNARARHLLGQREDLAAGLSHLPTVYRLHRPDGRPYPWDELPVYHALRNGTTSMRDDIVVHRPDGRRVPLVTWAAPVNLAGGSGEHDAAVWVLEDLSGLRQAEAARQETELRLRVIVETMAEGLVVQNQSGLIVDCNAAACAILGASAAQLRTWSALAGEAGCLGEDGKPLPRDEQPDRVVFRTGKPVRDLVLGLRPPAPANGEAPATVRWLLANSMPVSLTDKLGDSRGLRCVTTFADITAHRQALEVLRHSEEQYRGLVETLPLMLLQFDADGTLSYFNPATETITGYGAEQLRRAGFWRDCVHSDDQQALAALLAGGGQPGRLEFRYRAADGSERVGYAVAQPRRPGGTAVLVVDMTQRRRMEQELQKVQRLDLVGRIAGGVVHDFNNLLTVIIGSAELARAAAPEHPARADLERLLEAADQATLLANQLLAFSKQRQVVLREIDVNATVARSLDLLRSALPPTIAVELRTEPGGARVLADVGPLQQVLMNLCLNARDAMPRGGRLVVEVGQAEALPTAVKVPPPTANGAHGWVRLSVADDGCGMDEAVQARIFEPLFTTKERGSGLGLAVVQQIVEGLGGGVEVHSAPGKGARFDVWLPACSPQR
jgi:PAS domain S-box-containing protein